jgi:hypothetical protein
VVLLLVGTFVLFFLRDYFTRAVEVITNETGRSLLTGVLGDWHQFLLSSRSWL